MVMCEQNQINKRRGLVYQAKNKHAWQNDYLNNNKQANINVKSRRFGIIITPFIGF